MRPQETNITLLTIKHKEGAASGRNGMGLAGRNEKSYQLLTHLLALLVWQRGLQSAGLTKHSSAESSLSEKLHREEDEHKASVFSSFPFFGGENPFKVATCVYLAASPCHSHTSTRSKWVVPHFTGTVITIVLCFVQAKGEGGKKE